MNTGSPGTSQLGSVLPPTERRNPRTIDIDVVSTVELLQMVNQEDRLVPLAVGAALPSLVALVEGSLPRLRAGGHLHYFGSGTSGRLGALDAAELIPTYGVAQDFAVAHCAGGAAALQRAVEGAEDDPDAGRAEALELSRLDVAIGLSASGSTPYVAGALQRAREVGAFTGLITANPAAPLAELVEVHVALDTGPEAITGSTRMKAGSAQKMALSSFSTALMVRLGRSYSNLMVDVTATNRKLRARLVSILEQATGLERSACQKALAAADGSLKVALVSLLGGVEAVTARAVLDQSNDQVRQALELLAPASTA